MDHYYIPAQSENIPIHQQLSLGHTEYRLQGQPQHPVFYQQQASTMLSTFPVIVSHHIMQQASPPESPRSLCSSSDESHQKSNSVVPKKKRTRTEFNSFQVMELEREYTRCMYMQRHRRQEVAQRLSLDEKHIKIWFQNRRMRYKREGKLLQKEKTIERVETECMSNVSSDHGDIVKHFMSFAQNTLTQQSAPASLEFKGDQALNLLPPSPPPTESTELTNILDLLVNSSPTSIPVPSTDLSGGNLTDILDYLQETSKPTSKQNTLNKADDFGDILEYLTELSVPTVTPKEDSDLTEILNYLSENSPNSNDIISTASSVTDADISLDKIRDDLEQSAEAFAKQTMPTPRTFASPTFYQRHN